MKCRYTGIYIVQEYTTAEQWISHVKSQYEYNKYFCDLQFPWKRFG